MNVNREKENFANPSNDMVSVNGVQVWIDNKFGNDDFDDALFSESFEKDSEKSIEKQHGEKLK